MNAKELKILSKQRADEAVGFFNTLSHTKGIWKGVKFELLPWQEEIIRDIFGTLKKDGYRQYNTAYIEVPKKNGKALALDTMIPTPSGWSTMGELKVGDIIFDETGNQCDVIGVTDVMENRPCYEMEFSDGNKIIADANHEWKTLCYKTGRKNGKRFHNEDYLHTTENIYKTLEADRPYDIKKGLICKNHRIEVADKLYIENKKLEIHPYVLGVWLGDGCSANASVTCAYDDIQIIEELKKTGLTIREWKSSGVSTGQFAFGDGNRSITKEERENVPHAIFRKMGLLNNKHIPKDYLRASISQRTELLQGLMDTDGYVSKAGQCEFTSTSRPLADGVLELLHTLGLKSRISVSRAMLYGKDCGKKYRIQFWAYKDYPVFKLSRKTARQKQTPKKRTRSGYIQINNVTPIQSVPVKCIQVDSPSNLYLVGESMIPTHNSEIGAGIGLKLLCADGEKQAQVYGCGADRAQASLIYDVAVDMVEQNPALKRNIKIIASKHRLVYLPNKSFYQVCSAEAYTKDGLDASGVIFDEIHAQPNREFYDVMTMGSGDARMQPLTFIMTTAGDDPDEVSIGWEVHQEALGVLNGTLNIPNMYAKVYALPEGADWEDEKEWLKWNPSIGHHLRIETFRNAYLKAKVNPVIERKFKQLRLNQWTKTKYTSWVGLNIWDDNTGAILLDKLKGRKCYGGLDLSSKLDLTAFALIFPPDDNNTTYDILMYYWIPEDGMNERSKRDNVPYKKWVDQGLIMTTPGNVIDYRFIQKTIIDLRDEYNILAIGFDPWNAQQTATELEDMGLTMIEIRQGYKSMSPPMKELEAFLIGRRMKHGGNPVLRWNFSNLQVKQDENANIRPAKNAGKKAAKIDGVVAVINSLAPLIRNIEDEDSVYETRGVLSV